MAFSINTNLSSLKAYNALATINAETQKAQLRLATTKKINSVSDDTSGYNVGKKLEAQTLKQKAQSNNVASAKNYMSTAETALQQINDKLNQISSKYTDSRDPLKDSSSIASDIRTLAGEVDSILKNTNINGHNLLAQADGNTLASNDTFDVSGSAFSADFASNTYLKADALKAALHGGTSVSDPGVFSYTGPYFNGDDPVTLGDTNTTTKFTFGDGTIRTFNIDLTGSNTVRDVMNKWLAAANIPDPPFELDLAKVFGPAGFWKVKVTSYRGISGIETTSGFDATSLFGITLHPQPDSSTGGLMDSNDSTVLSAASDISAISNNVKQALGRIGNLTQTLDSRSDFLTSAIANNSASISSIFDADVAAEQLNATKGTIAGQVGTTILAQLNSSPQRLMSLFS